jgi:replication factor A1
MTRVKIGSIKPEMRNLEVVGEIVDIGEKMEIETRFGPATITPAVLRDETGSIRLNLWRWQAGMVKKGDRIMLVNAFVRTFKGNMELNIGRDGKIIVLDRKVADTL